MRISAQDLSAEFYHVGYTSSHSKTEVKQHWAWILLGWETLQGIPGSAGTFPPPPCPLQTEYSLFRLSLSHSSDWDLLNQKKNEKKTSWEFTTKLFTIVVRQRSKFCKWKLVTFYQCWQWARVFVPGRPFQVSQCLQLRQAQVCSRTSSQKLHNCEIWAKC